MDYFSYLAMVVGRQLGDGASNLRHFDGLGQVSLEEGEEHFALTGLQTYKWNEGIV